MKKVLNFKYICICLAAIMIVFTNKVQAATGKVATETLNLRKEASTNSSIIELLNANDKLEIVSEENGWYKVKHGSKDGYVSKEYVEVDDESDIEEEPETTTPTDTTNKTDNTDNTEQVVTNVEPNSILKLEQDVAIKILPLINANELGSVKAGNEITVITTVNNWIFVQTDDIAGWIIKDSTVGQKVSNEDSNKDEEIVDEKNTDEDVEDDTNKGNNEKQENDNSNDKNYDESIVKYINASSVYLRSEPSTSADIITALIRNTDVKVVGESGDWYKVKFNNYNGFIRKDLLSDNKVEETNRSNSNREQGNVANISNKGEEIVTYAKKYLGCPYVYGAAGSKSFDCSGFTQYVYKNFGYSLSHSATAQSKIGTQVSKENLQPGDLVFFLDYETMDGIGHCGIYIGEGNFIHASSGSGYCVKISTLLSGSYDNRYVTARRLI